MAHVARRSAHGAWLVWQPALRGLEQADCSIYYHETLMILFIDVRWRSAVDALEVRFSLPTDMAVAARATAAAMLFDVTVDEVERVSHGQITVEGSECILRTMGVFVADRVYRTSSQVACRREAF